MSDFLFATPEKDLRLKFDEDGFVVLKLAEPDEVEPLANIMNKSRTDPESVLNFRTKPARDGRQVELAEFNEAVDDNPFGRLGRSDYVAEVVRQLLDDDCYPISHKLLGSKPQEGGGWSPHQDFAYWNAEGFWYPRPRMGTLWLAISEVRPDNAGLYVYEGSHKEGLVSGDRESDNPEAQRGIDPEFLARVERDCKKVEVHLRPGYALFFHSCLVHGSGNNLSDDERWVLAIPFSRMDNGPSQAGSRHAYPPMRGLELIPHDTVFSDASLEGFTGATEFLTERQKTG